MDKFTFLSLALGVSLWIWGIYDNWNDIYGLRLGIVLLCLVIILSLLHDLSQKS